MVVVLIILDWRFYVDERNYHDSMQTHVVEGFSHFSIIQAKGLLAVVINLCSSEQGVN